VPSPAACPVHTWLPEVAGPASAVLSAVLLGTGMYAVIGFLAIARARPGGTCPRAVLLGSSPATRYRPSGWRNCGTAGSSAAAARAGKRYNW
jgi:hypothetical protein